MIIEEKGKLYLVPTPIGNLEDITFRCLKVLKEVSLIAAEDTRNSIKLLNHFDIHTPLTSYHEFNRFEKAEELMGLLKEGKDLALISDAGSPCISDPGEVLVKRAIEEGVEVVPLPGACAAITALIASGLDPKSFVFQGFPSREKKELREMLKELMEEKRTMIFYEAPHRLKKTLAAFAEGFGEERRMVLGRELTKLHEEFERGTAGELLLRYQEKEPRGEYVVLVEGREEPSIPEEPLSVRELMERALAAGLSEKDAMKETARELGVSKRDIYREWKLQPGVQPGDGS